MGTDVHEKRDRDGIQDKNPLAKSRSLRVQTWKKVRGKAIAAYYKAKTKKIRALRSYWYAKELSGDAKAK